MELNKTWNPVSSTIHYHHQLTEYDCLLHGLWFFDRNLPGSLFYVPETTTSRFSTFSSVDLDLSSGISVDKVGGPLVFLFFIGVLSSSEN